MELKFIHISLVIYFHYKFAMSYVENRYEQFYFEVKILCKTLWLPWEQFFEMMMEHPHKSIYFFENRWKQGPRSYVEKVEST